jgi:hypothetical protein
VVLTFLEVEEFDGITKNKEKCYDEAEMDEHNVVEEVMSNAKIVLQELLHHHRAPAGN